MKYGCNLKTMYRMSKLSKNMNLAHCKKINRLSIVIEDVVATCMYVTMT